MRLRELARNCEFGDIDKEIKIQLVEKCTSTRVRRKTLREEISLEDLMKYGRTMETSDRQIAQFESLHQSGIQVNNLDVPKSCFFLWWRLSPRTRKSVLPCHKENMWSLWRTGPFRSSVQNEIWCVTESSKVSNATANYKF